MDYKFDSFNKKVPFRTLVPSPEIPDSTFGQEIPVDYKQLYSDETGKQLDIPQELQPQSKPIFLNDTGTGLKDNSPLIENVDQVQKTRDEILPKQNKTQDILNKVKASLIDAKKIATDKDYTPEEKEAVIPMQQWLKDIGNKVGDTGSAVGEGYSNIKEFANQQRQNARARESNRLMTAAIENGMTPEQAVNLFGRRKGIEDVSNEIENLGIEGLVGGVALSGMKYLPEAEEIGSELRTLIPKSQAGTLKLPGVRAFKDIGIDAKVGESLPSAYSKNIEQAEANLPGRTEALRLGISDEQLNKDLMRNNNLNQYISENINDIRRYAKAKGMPLPSKETEGALGAHQAHIDGETLEQRGWTWVDPNQRITSKNTTIPHETITKNLPGGVDSGHREELRQGLEKANGNVDLIQKFLNEKSKPYDHLLNTDMLSSEDKKDFINLRQLYPEAEDLSDSDFLNYLSVPGNTLTPTHALMAENIRKASHFSNVQNLELEKTFKNLVDINGFNIHNLTPDEVLMFSKNKNINQYMQNQGIDLGDQLKEIIRKQMQPKRIIIPNKNIIAPSIQLKKP